jgi:N6-adenosine-specific RNA methylase IME4
MKGSIERKDASISQIIYSPIEEHSKKPDIVRDKIVKLCGNLPRIELFARKKVKGWDTYGNEVD